MASPRKQFLLIALLFMLSNDPSVASPELSPDRFRICTFTKKHVYIENELGGNEILSVNCKSRDDDLGVHQLKNGETYEFHFKDTFLGDTTFKCNVSYSRKNAEFVAYEQLRDCYYRCHKRCRWNATRDAVLGYSDTKPPKEDITVPWQG